MSNPENMRGGWGPFEAALQAGNGHVSSPAHIVARFFAAGVEVHANVVVVVPRVGEYLRLPISVMPFPVEVFAVVHDLQHPQEAARGELVVNVYVRSAEIK